MSYTDYLETVQKYYIAYYQRPADPGGLRYWAERLDSNGGDTSGMIEAFANSAESDTLYGEINESNIETVINDIYNAAFNRDADAGGLEYYKQGFIEGRFTAATIMVNIIDGARNQDLDVLNNKLEASEIFTGILDPDGDGQDPVYTYAGNEDAQEARDWLSTVDDTVPDASSVESEIQSKIDDSPVFTSGNTLTTSEDNSATYTAAATDADGDTLTYSLKTDASNGSVTDNGDGTFTFTP
ncbi:MAG TPA: hypothetical protein DHM44_07430, partial [Flexistipes sinusarabici]|nr:hypothetical protein [Flexistipes sinusarabici]